MNQVEVITILVPTGDALHRLINEKIAPLPMCTDSAIALMMAVQSILPMNQESISESWRLSEFELVRLREAATAFDTALNIQFDHLDTYRVMPKGTHDTRKLIEHSEMAFGSNWKHVVHLAQGDWQAASRCLAFDLPTACGFHAIRAMEAQVLGYLKLKNLTPKKRDLGHYVELLKQAAAAPEAINLVDHLRANHRNPLMHPEDTLDIPEALAVFDLTKASITYLIVDAKVKGLIL